MRAPAFWTETGLLPDLLAPAAALYALGAVVKEATTTTQQAPVPVICIGNAVASGAGKTPVALSIGAALARRGRRPCFRSAVTEDACAGRFRWISPDTVRATSVTNRCCWPGPARTVVAADRPAGAALAARHGADVIVMDDGLQNPTLAKDLSLLVVDGGFGFGNGRVMPAGPLREPLSRAFGRIDAAVLVGTDETGVRGRLPADLTVLEARLAPAPGAGLTHRRVLAFAGIGRPEKLKPCARSPATWSKHSPFPTTTASTRTRSCGLWKPPIANRRCR